LKAIQYIKGKLPNTNRDFSINVVGRNVLIVGDNGSGKTSFLEALNHALQKHISQGALNTIDQLKLNIESLEVSLETTNQPATIVAQWKESLDYCKSQLADISLPYYIEYNAPKELIERKKLKDFFISYFPAFRRAAIDSVSHATGSKVDLDSIDLDQNLGRNLEQHLVNLKVRAALGDHSNEDLARTDEIAAWLNGFEKNLKYLFEDESLSLKFSADSLRFKIQQKGKIDYTFQTLSSGYLAIFDIYADLLIRAAFLDIIPEKLAGIVLIDEIDVHLHVSLQRKVLPFFARSFPRIQIIATTHSPFVVTSTTDTLIYDLTSGNESGNLSMYSIEAVVEGLLGVTPVSVEAENVIKRLAQTTSEQGFDLDDAEKLIKKISPYVDSLDAESKMFYELAVNKIISKKAEGA
jgi:predicted ATP-binding protein involved in virulence